MDTIVLISIEVVLIAIICVLYFLINNNNYKTNTFKEYHEQLRELDTNVTKTLNDTIKLIDNVTDMMRKQQKDLEEINKSLSEHANILNDHQHNINKLSR